MNLIRCADCGANLVRVRDGVWAKETDPGVWVTTCRSVIEGDRMLSADYHYVEGETQRHFAAKENV